MREVDFQEPTPEDPDLSAFGYTIFASFPKFIRKQVRLEQDFTCANCEEHPEHKLQVHHIVPESLGGAQIRENAIGLCGEQDNGCHQLFDQLALEEGIIWPGIPLDDAPPKLFKK